MPPEAQESVLRPLGQLQGKEGMLAYRAGQGERVCQ